AVPPLPAEVQAQLRAFLPAEASVANPVDMIAAATAQEYRRSLEILLSADACDAVIVICVPTRAAVVTDVAKAVAEARAAAPHKPVLSCLMTARPIAASGGDAALQPVYRFPDPAAMALARAARYAAWRSAPLGTVPELAGIDAAAGRAVCRRALRRGGGWLLPEEVDQLLAAFGLPRPPARFAFDEEEAAAAAAELGYPVAVKLASATLVH